MSKFTKHFKRSFPFDGDTVEVTMTRLKRKDAIKLAPFMTEPDENGKVTMALEDSMKFADVASAVIMKNIITFTGLNDEDGIGLNVDDVFGEEAEAYFMPLVSEIISDLMDASFVGTEDEKKLEKPVNDTLEA